MQNFTIKNSQGSPGDGPQIMGFSPGAWLKSKRISYLTLPLLFMATVTEFVILSTGWKYQQVVCVPKGMGVTFFGIGPIGATILACELLKLPLAVWTASRHGWAKAGMMAVGLPLICLLTFQLVKDMAVYEMGVALAPASQMLDKATTEEVKISQLSGELASIDQKKTDRDQKLAALAARKIKAKAELEEELKRNDVMRQDAISLTDYQQKELSEVESRQAAIVRQFNNDTVPLNKALEDLRARREAEFPRAAKWNAEEARIQNEYNKKLAEYNAKKAAYEKDKVEYAKAGFLKRHLMGEPVDPGAAPDREVNTVVKPSLIGELDAQIAAKEAELLAVSNKRRDRLAEVSDEARKVREQFDQRSTAKREDIDHKREQLVAAETAQETQWTAEEKQINQNFETAAQKADAIQAELDACRKTAEGYYELREADIKNTQVHRIATTVEIVRGLLMGQRPVSIKATAKERGDIYTDQISMVRIWVYPVLAFIVAFLPTLMVEVGFSTLFEPEKQRPTHRLGFFGRNLHWLEVQAGRRKIAAAERKAREARTEIAVRDRSIAAAKVATERQLLEKDAELHAVHEALVADAAAHTDQLQQKDTDWSAKLATVSASLTEALAEKDALRSFQQSEIERQVQQRQNTWTDRLNQMRQEMDTQRTAGEAERTALTQEHRKKLLEVADEWRSQVTEVRRLLAEAEQAAEEKSSRLTSEIREALSARDAASSQLQLQAQTLSLKVTQTREEAAREIERAARQEKQRAEQQQSEFARMLRQASEEAERRLHQRDQELSREFDARLAQEQTKAEQESRRRDEEFARQLETRTREVDARWKQDDQAQEATVQTRLKQQEQQLLAQTDVRIREVQAQADEQSRRRELEFQRQLDAKTREVEAAFREELQQKELVFHAQLKQREQALTSKAVDRETELQKQLSAEVRTRENEWVQQAESRVRATEARLGHEIKQKDEFFQLKLRQREQQLQLQSEARQAELQAQFDQEMRQRDAEFAEARKREQALTDKLDRQAEAHQLAETEWKTELETARASLEPLKALLVRTELECDLDRQSASAGIRQVQELKKKLDEASSVLNGTKSGKSWVGNQA